MSDAQKYSSKLYASRILIIGGSSGIGYAVAEACLESGAHVAISSSNPSRVQSAVTSLQSSYPSKKSHIHGLTVELSKPDTLESELEQVLQGAAEKVGNGNGQAKLDHVIFTAGDALAEIKLPDMTYKNVVQAGQVRFFAPLLLAKFLPQFLESSYKSSYTITTGSISEHTIPNWSVIASYAGGHHSMVRNLALDMKPIRVNGVSPGVVDTPLWKQPAEEKKKMLDAFAKKLTTGRAGQAEDVAESFMGVIRDWNATGHMVRTDGGAPVMA